jgi:hypothetical protein
VAIVAVGDLGGCTDIVEREGVVGARGRSGPTTRGEERIGVDFLPTRKKEIRLFFAFFNYDRFKQQSVHKGAVGQKILRSPSRQLNYPDIRLGSPPRLKPIGLHFDRPRPLISLHPASV